MDVRTGHLVSPDVMKRMRDVGLEGTDRYVEVPTELEEAARRKLAGAESAMVSLRSGGKLARWAAKVRRKVEAQRAK